MRLATSVNLRAVGYSTGLDNGHQAAGRHSTIGVREVNRLGEAVVVRFRFARARPAWR